jgi:hypothetical protein
MALTIAFSSTVWPAAVVLAERGDRQGALGGGHGERVAQRRVRIDEGHARQHAGPSSPSASGWNWRCRRRCRCRGRGTRPIRRRAVPRAWPCLRRSAAGPRLSPCSAGPRSSARRARRSPADGRNSARRSAGPARSCRTRPAAAPRRTFRATATTAVAIAITSRENSDSSMPARPWVTPSHIAGTPPATCALPPHCARPCGSASDSAPAAGAPEHVVVGGDDAEVAAAPPRSIGLSLPEAAKPCARLPQESRCAPGRRGAPRRCARDSRARGAAALGMMRAVTRSMTGCRLMQDSSAGAGRRSSACSSAEIGVRSASCEAWARCKHFTLGLAGDDAQVRGAGARRRAALSVMRGNGASGGKGSGSMRSTSGASFASAACRLRCAGKQRGGVGVVAHAEQDRVERLRARREGRLRACASEAPASPSARLSGTRSMPRAAAKLVASAPRLQAGCACGTQRSSLGTTLTPDQSNAHRASSRYTGKGVAPPASASQARPRCASASSMCARRFSASAACIASRSR